MKVKLWFSGNPIPKGRPRFSDEHFYTPERTQEWEETVGWQCRAQFKHSPLTGPLGIEFTFYRGDHRIVDLDNLEKAMLDALESILYLNDHQIKVKSAELIQGSGVLGVVVTVWQL